MAPAPWALSIACDHGPGLSGGGYGAPENNDRVVVIKGFVEEKQRYQVELDNTEKKTCLKRANLELLALPGVLLPSQGQGLLQGSMPRLQ